MNRLSDLLIGVLIVASFVGGATGRWQVAQYLVLLAIGLELAQHRPERTP